jgi:hypothetical protein
LIDATIENLTEGLAFKRFTSVDLVKVRLHLFIETSIRFQEQLIPFTPHLHPSIIYFTTRNATIRDSSQGGVHRAHRYPDFH